MRPTATRREVLGYVGAGSVGLGGVGAADAGGRSAARQSADGANRLEVRTVAAAREIRYEFAAAGPVRAVTRPEAVAAEPDGNDAVQVSSDAFSRAVGVTGRGKSDTWRVGGDLVWFNAVGSPDEYALVWNGEAVSPPTPGNRFVIRTAPEAREVRYEFAADGRVIPVTLPPDAGAEPTGNDTVEARSDETFRASGVTGRGKSDSYQVLGDVTGFQTNGADGEYALFWNGEQRGPSSLGGSGGDSDSPSDSDAEPDEGSGDSSGDTADSDSSDGSDGSSDDDSDAAPTDPVEFLGCSRFRIVGEYDAVYVQWGVYAEGRAPGGPRAPIGSVSGDTVVGYPDVFPSHDVDRSDYFHVKAVYAWEDVSGGSPSGRPDLSVENPAQGCLAKTAPEPPTLSVESVAAAGPGEYEVTFVYVNPATVVVRAADEFAAGNSPDAPPGTLRPGRHTFTATWRPSDPDERLRWAFSPAGRPDETVSAATPPASEFDPSETASGATTTTE
ncbi:MULTISPECIES: hypothetical protein [Halorussus]|uniref:hypothetical protein n=1 Tax=Halorussus TaxID=1070314 RepID=UPI000E21694B|nr:MULTISPECIES: hypothetical protein [Halorussus]NHN58310.1 hypothetical protein [Halorussus sp. JP-T4]